MLDIFVCTAFWGSESQRVKPSDSNNQTVGREILVGLPTMTAETSMGSFVRSLCHPLCTSWNSINPRGMLKPAKASAFCTRRGVDGKHRGDSHATADELTITLPAEGPGISASPDSVASAGDLQGMSKHQSTSSTCCRLVPYQTRSS